MSEEHWVEVNIEPKQCDKVEEIVKGPVRAILERVKETKISWHYLYEPSVRLRVRFKDAESKAKSKLILEEELNGSAWKDMIAEYAFGGHGEAGKEYSGEQETYGDKGWEIMQRFLETGSEIGLYVLEKGVEKPVEFYASRFSHCLLDQLGYLKNFKKLGWLDEAMFYFKMFIAYLEQTVQNFGDLRNRFEELLKEQKNLYASLLRTRRDLA
jgi:hypothetical protein